MPDARRGRPSLWIAALVVSVSVTGHAGRVVDAVTGRALNVQGAVTGLPSQTAPATGLILGRVIDAATNRPMAGAVVRLADVGAPALNAMAPVPSAAPPVMTNAQGHFIFRPLEAGRYTLTAQLAGYMPGAFGQRRPGSTGEMLVVSPGQRLTDLAIRMWKYAAVSGRVLDDAGEPLVNAPVRILQRRMLAGRRQLLPLVSTYFTDDRGMYRIATLPPGDYFIAVPATSATAPAGLGLDDVREMARGVMGSADMVMLRGGFTVGDWTVATSSSRGLDTGGVVAPQPSPDGRLLVFPTTFHPAASRIGDAAVVALDAGEERTDIDVRLALVPTLRVTGTVTGPEGAMAAATLTLVPRGDGIAEASGLETATAVADRSGRFAFLGVPPGEYAVKVLQAPPLVAERQAGPAGQTESIALGGGVMMASTAAFRPPPPPPAGPTLWADVPVTVGDRPVDDMAVVVRSGARLSGRIEFDGDAERPDPVVLQRMFLTVTQTNGTRVVGVPLGRFDAQGRFATAEYPAGRYWVSPSTGPGLGWTLKSIVAAGRNVLDAPLEIGSTDIADIVMTYTTRVGEVSGTVRRSSASQGAGGDAVVVLFPADYKAWIANSMPAGRSHTADVRPDGTFRASGLLAGDYVAAAVESVSRLELQNPDTIAALARIGSRVTLGDGDSRSVSLTPSSLR